MSGIASISGIISGMDTAGLVSSLMAIEAGPQTLLQSKQSGASSLVSALQSLNTKVASLATAAETAGDADSWKAVTAGSSADSVTATADSTAAVSSLTFTVDEVATSQQSLVEVPATFYSYPPTFHLVRGGETIEVTADSTSLADIVEAFNASGTGVTAASVNVNGTSYLQLTGTDTGTENAFTLSTQDSGGTWVDMSLTEITAASDASITLFGGTAAEETITQASNTFSDVLRGVDLTVSEVEVDPVTVSVSRDTSALGTLAKNLVTNLNTVLSDIASRREATTKVNDQGDTYVAGGLFSGSSTILGIQQDLLNAGSAAVSGLSLSQIGIELGSDGQFTYDADTFASALTADPSKVQSLLTSVADQVSTVAERASDSAYGSLTLEIQSQQSIVDDLTDRIDDWDDRLTMRQAQLEKTFTAMEVTLSTLQSQSDWLTSQLDALTASDS